MDSITFYKLGAPEYADDWHFARENPARSAWGLRIPGVRCPTCSTWGTGRRLYLAAPQNRDGTLWSTDCKPRFVSPEEWPQIAEAVRSAAGLPHDFPLEPGDCFGRETLELRASVRNDFMHPVPGFVVVVPRVIEALGAAGFTGFRAERIEPKMVGRAAKLPAPELYELVLTGRARRPGSEPDALGRCAICGRPLGTPGASFSGIDLATWDGSDLLLLDGRAVVTGRVRDLLEERGFTNYRCTPVPAAP